ncbi:EAL domain-containing protein [Neosynechococcus sphagnicola]|uniref:EAL domain-containing protein n=1 Tax=Neosynechococcus sphagnicola TaxID=1501145 RepID=UPI00068D2C71|nr:EAL domain-containing protein [Neosynechococcus sphagnicola]
MVPSDLPPVCSACLDGEGLDFDFTMAFQPIVDLHTLSIFAYEALVRGIQGEPAMAILSRVNDDNRYRFDQACRVKAIELAARLGMATKLSINFLPNAVYNPDTCIRTTLEAATLHQFPKENLIFEVTEGEKVVDQAHLAKIISHYKNYGFLTAIDDFGAGYSGLNLLAKFQPDLLKLDLALVRDIDQDRVTQAIVQGIMGVAAALNIRVIAEGVETEAELATLQTYGIYLFQGFLFAKPALESLPAISDLARYASKTPSPKGQEGRVSSPD